MNLSTEELRRYNRHIILPEIGLEGQKKLKKASVLVIGAGGLGCPILQYLSAAGIGTIGIVDFDIVSESNLHRQILFGMNDINNPKVIVAAEKLTQQNPNVKFEPHNLKLDSSNILNIVNKYDVIVDGSDNFPTRYLVNDACVIQNKPLVFGSIFKFDGQVSVFNYNNGPTYRCLFPTPPKSEDVPSCAQVGVLGVLPGLIGTLQANEVIKIILGIGNVLSGKLLYFDALSLNSHILEFDKNEETSSVTDLIDYEEFCGINSTNSSTEIDYISVDELHELIEQGEDIQIIDVREPHEFEICHINNSLLIPQEEIDLNISKIERDKPVIIYCHFGSRSEDVVVHLQNEYGFNNIKNLSGGIDEWAMEIDQNIERY